MPNLRDPRGRAELFLVVSLLAVAFVARYVGRTEVTGDMEIFFRWHAKLQQAGGWRGLGAEIGNYNAPYMYLLYLASLLPGSLLIGIKVVYATFDLLLAYFTYRLVEMHRGRRTGIFAALIMIMLPTVVLNASVWGQIDSMWASFAVGGVWMLARGRAWWGVTLCTLSLAFKPHGIFIFALVGLLVLAGRIKARVLLAVPVVWLVLSLPALLLGRNPVELFTIYSLDRQSGIIRFLTWGAPTIYAFMGGTKRLDTLRTLGYVLTAALVLGVFLAVLARRIRLDPTRIVTLAALFSILIPFGLPGMHDRYFFLADVTTLILAFYRPRLWFVPLLVQAASLGSYQWYLFGRSGDYLNLKVLAALMLAALIAIGYTLARDVLDGPFENSGEPPRTTSGEPPHSASGEPSRTASGEPSRTVEDTARESAAPSRALPDVTPLPPKAVGNTIGG
ncbi:glycosyltransferase 87 family protein [Actinoplanes sp. NEAU-A12]|uniref:Glycosyltransferase 87 family protein n=1 Tax=Actinoplanes sandaracinus TaxID=3045177 RepID=A0ABT6WCT0_9ACTN|nr:glycosyltransferase 87 family protein [Actinoplanes sandaracinus]MDI6097549.1 glycosyltransferase 87 family protein [Actinoplanes sandaracinus]